MPLETRELIPSVANKFLLDESTCMSENLTYLHHDPSIYMKLHHKFDIKKDKSQTVKKLSEKQSILGQTQQNLPNALRWFLYV